MKMNCIAVDDEALALNKIQRFVKKIDFLDLLESFDNAIDALAFIREHPVDLIFLDIQMEDLTGVQLLKSMKNPPMVIFTTAYESYALTGYELDVVDYLLKPIQFERFLKACEKVFDRFTRNRQNSEQTIPVSSTPESPILFVKSGNTMRRVDPKEILYIEGLKDYLLIYTVKGRIITLQTFGKILRILPENQFIRVHKSYVVALNKIDSIERNIIKIGNKQIPIGVTFKNQVYKITGDLMG